MGSLWADSGSWVSLDLESAFSSVSKASGYQTLVMSIVDLSESPHQNTQKGITPEGSIFPKELIWQQSRHREVLGTMREFEATKSAS